MVSAGGPAGPVRAPAPLPYHPKPWGLILLLIIAAVVVLAAGAIGITFLVDHHGDRYAVGRCVTRHDGRAVPSSCSAPGAYRIVKAADSRGQCPDPDGPVVVLQGAGDDPVRCLSPAK